MLARGSQTLIWTRTRHTNALRNALREYYPAALQAFDDWLTATHSPCWASTHSRAGRSSDLCGDPFRAQTRWT